VVSRASSPGDKGMDKKSKNLETIFQQAKIGNEVAFSQIYAATYQSQYYLAYHILHDSSLAEKVIQEIYITFFQNLHNIEHAWEIAVYLSRVNYQLCLKHKNQQMKGANYSFGQTNPDTEGLSLVSTYLDKLSYHLQATLILRYVNRLSVTDISFILGAPPRTVRRYIKKGLAEIKAMQKGL